MCRSHLTPKHPKTAAVRPGSLLRLCALEGFRVSWISCVSLRQVQAVGGHLGLRFYCCNLHEVCGGNGLASNGAFVAEGIPFQTYLALSSEVWAGCVVHVVHFIMNPQSHSLLIQCSGSHTGSSIMTPHIRGWCSLSRLCHIPRTGSGEQFLARFGDFSAV